MIDLISRRLRYAREKRDFTQADLSRKLGFKDRQTLAAIEAGQRKLSAEELVRATQILGVDLEFFTDRFRLVDEGSFSWRTTKHATPALLTTFEEKAGRIIIEAVRVKCWSALTTHFHIETVTHRENLLRGGTVTAKHAATTHCPKGHAYTEENTYRRKNKNSRECRACIRSRNMEAKRVRSRERRLARTNASTCADAASGSASP